MKLKGSQKQLNNFQPIGGTGSNYGDVFPGFLTLFSTTTNT